MNNQELNQSNPSMDPSSGSSESRTSSDSSPEMNGQSNPPVESMQSTQIEKHEEKQKINLVKDENHAGIPSTNHPAFSTNEAAMIPDTWLTKDEVDQLRTRWNAIQFQFVDSPCSAVEQGDTLVADVIEHITHTLSTIQNSLNQQWINHDNISTEELRYTLQNYRTVLNRLLSM